MTKTSPTLADAYEYLRSVGSPAVAGIPVGTARRQYRHHLLTLAANRDPYWYEQLQADRWRAKQSAVETTTTARVRRRTRRTRDT
jgi:hypothetical protein